MRRVFQGIVVTGLMIAHFPRRIGVLSLGFVAVAQPVAAIPSPELVIGSVSSLAQVGTFLSAILGGGILAALRSRGGFGAQKQSVAVLVGLLLACVALIGVNIYQFTAHRAAVSKALQATLVRPANSQVGQANDASLRETSFARQTEHPNAISTAAAERLLHASAEGENDTLLFDIRETAENSTGTIPGARHVRFPDFDLTASDLAGKKVVLFCHNGNRSSETCEKLAAMGIDCRFIAGGLEKWIVEGRSFTDSNVRGLDTLRAIPAFDNDTRLLTTGAVHDLIGKSSAIFVDVRYPGEFASGHLAGAINIPLRALASDDLGRLIGDLPKKPIIAACYDRRGCFISKVLGYELSQAGYDFQGRYTLPWEYFEPSAVKPHIRDWLQEQQNGPWARAVGRGARSVDWLVAKSGPLWALLLLSILMRLLVLPVATKSESDQLVLRAKKAELDSLKSRTLKDPVLRGRMLREFNLRNGLTPSRNLLALLFLPVTMLGLASVGAATGLAGISFLWLDDITRPDPTFVLPAIFSAIAACYLVVAVANTRRQRALWGSIGCAVLFGLTMSLPAAGNIYLTLSVIWIFVQRLFVTGLARRASRRAALGLRVALSRRNLGLVSLGDAERTRDCGNKAHRLSIAKRHGIPVPDGVVMSAILVRRYLDGSDAFQTQTRARIRRMTGGHVLAVRSSGGLEDGKNQSFAGIYESELDVTAGDLDAAIRKVAASFQSEAGRTYSNLNADEFAGNILVQKMVAAEFSGVLFTRDPSNPGASVLETVPGTADALVAGRVSPERFAYGRFSLRCLGPDVPETDFLPLLKLGRALERIFGCPQDIEWTHRDGRFLIVQSRDITALGGETAAGDAGLREWARVFARLDPSADPEAILLAKDELTEVLPRPTPLSFDFMNRLWENGGSVDLACRQLGIEYFIPDGQSTHLETLFGRLFSNQTAKARNQVNITARAQRRFRRGSGQFVDEFSNDFAPDYLARMRFWEKVALEAFSVDELLHQLTIEFDDFAGTTHVAVEKVNVAARYFFGEAETICEMHGIDFAETLGSVAIPADIAHGNAGFVQQGAHRAEFDYELSCPRYGEISDGLEAAFGVGIDDRAAATRQANPARPLPPDVAAAVRCAAELQGLKETAKDISLIQVGLIRRLLLALDKRVGSDGLVFFLHIAEIPALGTDQRREVLSLAARRRDRRAALLETVPLAPRLSAAMLEQQSCAIVSARSAGPGRLDGQRVAGSARVAARAYVADAAKCEVGGDLPGFEAGDILVCAMIHPDWLGAMLKSGGVIAEVGGWLSHFAILARENDIAMVVGSTAHAELPDCARISIERDGGVKLLERVKFDGAAPSADSIPVVSSELPNAVVAE